MRSFVAPCAAVLAIAAAGCSLPRGTLGPTGDTSTEMDADVIGVDVGPGDDAWSADDTGPADDVGLDLGTARTDTGPACMDHCEASTAVHCTTGGAVRTDCTTGMRCSVAASTASCVPSCAPGAQCSMDGTTLETCDATGVLTTMPCPRGCTAGACRAEVACSVAVGPTIVAPGSMVVNTCGQRDDDAQTTMHGDCPDHGPNGEDVVLRLDVDHTEIVTITATDVDGSRPIDPCIYVRTACADQTSEVDCNDDGASTALDAQISDLVLTPGEYFLVVDAFNWNDGSTHYNCGMIQVDVTVAPL